MTFTVKTATATFLLDVETLDELMALADGVGKLVVDLATMTVTVLP